MDCVFCSSKIVPNDTETICSKCYCGLIKEIGRLKRELRRFKLKLIKDGKDF